MTDRRPGTLRSGREFDTAFREGIAVSGPLFVVRARPNELGMNRFGFAVGKRIAPLATDRNRAKRRMLEAARRVPLASGFDFIVVARPASLRAAFGDLSAELQSSLSRAALKAGT